VDELDKAISVAARDPALYGIDEVELEKRRRWTSTARTQVDLTYKYCVYFTLCALPLCCFFIFLKKPQV
jgi:hypothetical protein